MSMDVTTGNKTENKPEANKMLTVSASPHAKNPRTVRGIMLDVIIALIPAAFAGVTVFGARAALVMATCVAACVLFEYLARRVMKRHNTVGDLTAVITGLLLAFNLPVQTPIWICVIGAFVAIVVVKQFFGGVGQNFANPAITARVVLLVSFASAMTGFTSPVVGGADAVSSATPLASLGTLYGAGTGGSVEALLAEGRLPTLTQMFLGVRPGCIGETCALALLLGAAYLLIRGVIRIAIPAAYLLTFAAVMLCVSGFDLPFVAYELLSGGLLLGAFFMATDYTTSPVNAAGKVVFGIGCGALTAVIRLYGSLPEGVSYSILLMNVACPLIEKFTAPKYFGFIKTKKTKKAGDAA